MLVKSPAYYSFMLRIWSSTEASCQVWRASLEDPLTRQVMGFGSIEALTEYLKQQTTAPPNLQDSSDSE
jgi:hypothetical protein